VWVSEGAVAYEEVTRPRPPAPGRGKRGLKMMKDNVTRLRKKEPLRLELDAGQTAGYREMERARDWWKKYAEELAVERSADVYVIASDGKTLFRAYPR
jgi:hypothetical protein